MTAKKSAAQPAPDEVLMPDMAHKLFLAYRDMPAPRSYTALAEREGTTRYRIARMARQYDWAGRLAKYDAEFRKTFDAVTIDDTVKARAEQLEQIRRAMRTLGKRMASPGFGGRGLRAKDVVSCFKVLALLDRLYTGQSTENVQAMEAHEKALDELE